MALPRIAPYPLPALGSLPQNRVDWRPDPRRAVLLVHDMQRYFLAAFEPGTSPLTDAVSHIRALAAGARALGMPVVYSAQPGGQTREQRGLQQDFWGDGIPGDEGSQIVDALAPEPGDVLMTKWRYSAFQRTRLAELLAETGRDQLVITGVYAHIGCLATANEAFMRDVQAFVVADALADFSAEHHRHALEYAAQRCAVVLPAARVLEELTASTAVAGR
ncbi:isochorismatase family protein [Motilibacter aurantiacus]|uniref:isochorismatase family protein n=1 Tax=Motilibacter aurantiacus TaxID=2714955 RepID=UPI001408E6AA|nr:isochorismatase family protein [Motilibacter aurantiacus]NHC45396.1 isochorismatase family protein [Motilibacter aurantiacus]